LAFRPRNCPAARSNVLLAGVFLRRRGVAHAGGRGGRRRGLLDRYAHRELVQPPGFAPGGGHAGGLDLHQLGLLEPGRRVGRVAQELADALVGLRNAVDGDQLPRLPDRREVDALGGLARQFVERRVALDLQVFDRLLSRGQRLDLGAQRGDVLDLRIQPLDLVAQELVARRLGRRHLLQHGVPGTGDRHAGQRRHAEPGVERPLALLALLFAVRQQVDEDHCRNLRIASPQAVR
jgi:hypothetical protein